MDFVDFWVSGQIDCRAASTERYRCAYTSLQTVTDECGAQHEASMRSKLTDQCFAQVDMFVQGIIRWILFG